MDRIIHIAEGLRVVKRRLNVAFKGTKKYSGSAEQICRQIVDDCWNGRYFQTSCGHFSQFWTRDFGWCTESLLRLGYREKVRNSLEYALKIFSSNNCITTTITPDGKPFDFPCYSPDSLALLIHSLKLLNNKKLINKYEKFLNTEIKKYYEIVIDKRTGLVKTGHFSSIKDNAIRKSSCYDNCMAAMLSNDLNTIKILNNPFKNYDYKKLIKETFWNGKYFLDDTSGSSYVAGDANLFPYWCGIFSDKKMISSSIKHIQNSSLDKPFPLKYTSSRAKLHEMILTELLVKGYERTSIWTHMGPLFIEIVAKVNKELAKKYLKQYKTVIEKNKNYLEVFTPEGKPFKKLLYSTDEGMIWAVNYLRLKNEL